jgi:hypothetical protein
LPRLVRRATMLNRAIFWPVAGSISISVLIVVAFVSAFEIQHERGVAILLIVSVAAFMVSLVDFAREVRLRPKSFAERTTRVAIARGSPAGKTELAWLPGRARRPIGEIKSS